MSADPATGEIAIVGPALEELVAQATLAAPAECCGLLLGAGNTIEQIRPAANVAAESGRRFEIDPQTLIDAYRMARRGGPEVIGYYHSHPDGPARPSTVDRAQAAGDGRVWAIAAQGDVTFWRDGEQGFEPLSYTVAGR
jgi:desampylase